MHNSKAMLTTPANVESHQTIRKVEKLASKPFAWRFCEIRLRILVKKCEILLNGELDFVSNGV